MDLTNVGRKMSDTRIPEIDSTPFGAKMSNPKTPTTESSTRKEKSLKEYYQRIRSQTGVRQSHCPANLICLTTENIKAKYAIKIEKSEK